MKNTLRWLLSLALFGAQSAWCAEVVVGQTADLSSVAGSQMREFNAGATLYVNAVNARGGVGGKTIRLLSMDDGYVTETAAQNAQALAAKPEVVALFGTRGSNPTEAVIKVAERERLALIAPVNGADVVRESKFVFPVRASYRSEVDGVLNYLNAAGGALAVAAQDDKFGRPLLDHIEKRLAEGKYGNLKLAGSVLIDRKATTLGPEVTKVLALKPRAVVALCNPAACAEFVKELQARTRGSKDQRPTVAQLSNVDMKAQFDQLGGDAVTGHPFVQVLPDPRRPSLQISRDFVAAATEAGVPVNYRSYEGYVAAAVLVEGLKRAKTLTRQGVLDAMESLGSVNLGGIVVEYTAARHAGSNFVELVSLDSHGRLMR